MAQSRFADRETVQWFLRPTFRSSKSVRHIDKAKMDAVLDQSSKSFFANQRLSILTALVAGIAASFLVVAIRGVPAPRIQDEFAYLLASETFASGRVTNPTHPMWQHFESFHIIHQPSYNAKYPPLQSMTLTVGRWLGHPIIGACLASGISIAALVWMLYGWLPEKVHWLAWIIAVTHPSFHLFWAHSYMGGAVALTGASLLLGAFVRLDHRLDYRLGIVAGLGVVLLANSRPFEGLVLTIAVATGLIVCWARTPEWTPKNFVGAILVPTVATLAIGVAGMLFYNQQVTGNALTMPYQVHESTYGWNPVFLWQTAGDKPEYRHVEMDRFFTEDKETTEVAYSTIEKTFQKKRTVVIGLLAFLCGPLILAAIPGAFFYREPKVVYLFAFLLPVFVASIISKWANFHYAAPATPLMLAFMIGGVYAGWERLQSYASLRRILVLLLSALHLVWFINVYSDTQKLHNGNWGKLRMEVIDQLESTDSDDLVFVRYTDDHNVHQEWVYNSADIDASSIVWAREINPERRVKLIEYFADRRVWILTADKDSYRLEPNSEPTLSSPDQH
ncbi:MAG: hypothetical protein AAFN77_06260 [Planctomycetota bacterium]